MKIVTTDIVCDREHRAPAAAATRRFSVDGADYEVDLCSKHGDEADTHLAAFIRHARPVVRKPGRRQKRRTAVKRASDRQVRAWWSRHPEASANAFQERGRLPRDVRPAFNAAMYGSK